MDNARRAMVKIAIAQSLFSDQNSKGADADGFSFRSAIEPEFENLVNLADSLKSREVREIARLEIARLYLEKK